MKNVTIKYTILFSFKETQGVFPLGNTMVSDVRQEDGIKLFRFFHLSSVSHCGLQYP